MNIQDIRHVGLLSPAIAAHTDYYLEVWGLQSAGEDRHARYLRAASTEHHILSLHPADRRGLHHLAFSLDGREAVDAAAAELERRGTTLVAQPADLDEPGGGYGLRFLDPENRCIELSAGVAEHPNGWSTRKVGPRRLCHVGLNTPWFEQIVEFYTDFLGFRVSDWNEDQMAFLRCDRRHHVIVFSRADLRIGQPCCVRDGQRGRRDERGLQPACPRAGTRLGTGTSRPGQQHLLLLQGFGWIRGRILQRHRVHRRRSNAQTRGVETGAGNCGPLGHSRAAQPRRSEGDGRRP